MKRVISLLLAFAMLLAIGGCNTTGKEGTQTQNSGAASENTASAPEASSGGASGAEKVRIMVPGTGGGVSDWDNNEILVEIEKATNTDIKLDWVIRAVLRSS
jgi:ABC-type glycerol-3-phosphate transport system substrate-binding protein